MSQVKLPYYPEVRAEATTTPAGYLETTILGLYDKPLKDTSKHIYRVDALKSLNALIGEDALFCRSYIYDIIAGKGEPYDMLSHLYLRHPGVKDFVIEQSNFGNVELKLADRCIAALRDCVNDYIKTVMQELVQSGRMKFLIIDHCYVYTATPHKGELTLLGGDWIC